MTTDLGETLTGQQKFIAIDNGRLGYTVYGTGPAILCVPGMGDTNREFEKFVPAMVKAGYQVITSDLRGNGLSNGIFKSYELSDLKNDIAAILDAENIKQAYIAACSISGASAGLFAVEQPERVLGLILYSPVFFSSKNLVMSLLVVALSVPGLGTPIWSSYFKMLYPKQPVEADYLAEVKANLKRKGGLKSLIGMCKTPHLNDKTNQVKVPTLIFFGTKDPDFKDVNAESSKVKAAIPQAEIEILEGYGHYPQREAAGTVLPKTLEWLRRQI